MSSCRPAPWTSKGSVRAAERLDLRLEWFGHPFILTQFVGFGLFLVASQAELTQTPFDMPVAESELVSGYMVEYTGFRFLFFFIGEFGTAFAFAALAATLFLGGWAIPGVTAGCRSARADRALHQADDRRVPDVLGALHLPPPAEDQLQALAWKVLIPVALANILITGIFKVAF